MSKRCNGKKIFDSFKEAKARLKEIQEISIKKRKPKRVYRCPVCSKYHLTAMTKKQKDITDIAYGREGFTKQEEIFIKQEAGYWRNKFKDKNK